MTTENAAARLLRLARRLSSSQRGVPVLQAWRSALQADTDAAVAGGLAEVSAEIDLVARLAPASPFPPEYYQEALDSLRGLLTLQNLHISWEAAADGVRPSVIKILEALSHTLPADDRAPSQGEVEDLLRELGELEEAVSTSDLEPPLVAVLLHYIQMFRSALHAYRVRGSTKLRDVVIAAAAGLEPLADSLRTKTAHPVVKRFFVFVARVGTVGEWWERGENVASFVTRAKALAGPVIAPLLDHAKKLLGPGSG